MSLDVQLGYALDLPLDDLAPDGVVIRAMSREDLPALQRLSPPSVKPVVQFFVYATLVAEIDGEVAGYTQFSLTPDGVLHSLAIRIGERWKGRGLGQQLMNAKVALAKAAGAKMHFYAIAEDGEAALKRIVDRLGMHHCQTHGAVRVYVASLDGEGHV